MVINRRQEKRFNVRSAIPDHMEIFADWRARSDAYKAERPDARLDLAYGDQPGERLDFFSGRCGGQRSPVVLLIHGGYWQAMDKDDNAFAVRALNDLGIAVAVVNHTLCPATSLENIIEEICRASTYLWREADVLGVDRDKMLAVGHSAGGHLAAMMMCIDWPAIEQGLPRDLFKGCLAISGLFDLTELVETTINQKVGLTMETARELSPIRHTPMSVRPIVAAFGGNETEGFADQATALQEAWDHHGIKVDILEIPGCHHFRVYETLEDQGSALACKISTLLGG